MSANRPTLVLKRGEDRRLRAGHLWVFSNEVDTARTPLRELQPGDPVVVCDDRERPLGAAYANPHSLICARLISRDPQRSLNEALLVHRLNRALELRRRHFDEPYYRLIHGDADGLSGLVVDRYGDICVIQPNTAGMDRALPALVSALERVLAPAHILVRGDSPLRELEGLPQTVHWATDPGPETLTVRENGLTFEIPATTGQKTGWYYDHRTNRSRLPPYVDGLRVLDVFSYTGAWGLQALAAGATSMTAVDRSPAALDQLQANAERNGLAPGVTCVEGDAFEVLQALRQDRERFDAVILDPPAFVKRRKDLRAGLAGYRRLNQLALQVLAHDGLLISASCSAHVDERQFTDAILAGARHVDRSFQVVERGGAAPDHPEHPAIPETRYLKALFARTAPARSSP